MRRGHQKKTTGKLFHYMIPSSKQFGCCWRTWLCYTHSLGLLCTKTHFTIKEKTCSVRNMDMYGIVYTYGAFLDITWTSAMVCCCGPQLYFWVELMSMNVGLNFSQHGHRTSSTQCNSFTSKSGISAYHAQYRFTHRYVYTNNIYKVTCVCIYTCTYLNISMKFKYLFTGIPLVQQKTNH